MSSIDPKRLANACRWPEWREREDMTMAILEIYDLYRAKHPSPSNQNNQCEYYGDDQPALPKGVFTYLKDGNFCYQIRPTVYFEANGLTPSDLRVVADHMEWKQRQASKAAEPVVTDAMILAACRSWFHQHDNKLAEFSERQKTEAKFMIQAALKAQRSEAGKE